MTEILITGNTGYIGTVMTGFFRERGYRVRGLDSGWFKGKCFMPLDENQEPDVQILKDIRYVDGNDLKGVSAVIHLAGLSNDPMGELNSRLTDEINNKATVRLAKTCVKLGIDRFIFSSSCSMYGISGADRPVDEKSSLNPITAYARAKVDAEKGLMALAGKKFHPVLMRNSTVYGLSPRLRLDLVVNNLTAWAFVTGDVAIMSDGTPWRPNIHVEDLCGAFKAVLEAPADKVGGQAFNVGRNTENYQVRAIARMVHEVLPGTRVRVLNKTGSDERTYRVDFTKFSAAFPEFKPVWTVKMGIKELAEAYGIYDLSKEDFESDKYFRIRSIRSLMSSGAMDEELVIKGGNHD
ncbi:MAG: SDR family oxidoreductase [Candidatus Omnitrophota bacterium]